MPLYLYNLWSDAQASLVFLGFGVNAKDLYNQPDSGTLRIIRGYVNGQSSERQIVEMFRFQRLGEIDQGTFRTPRIYCL